MKTYTTYVTKPGDGYTIDEYPKTETVTVVQSGALRIDQEGGTVTFLAAGQWIDAAVTPDGEVTP